MSAKPSAKRGQRTWLRFVLWINLLGLPGLILVAWMYLTRTDGVLFYYPPFTLALLLLGLVMWLDGFAFLYWAVNRVGLNTPGVRRSLTMITIGLLLIWGVVSVLQIH